MPAVYIIAALFALGRIFAFQSHPHAFTYQDVFKDAAHLFVAAIIGWGACDAYLNVALNRPFVAGTDWPLASLNGGYGWKLLAVAVALIVVETACFVWGTFG